MPREGRVRRCAAFIAIGATLVLTTAESRAAITVGEVQADPENCAGLFVFNQIGSTPAVPYAMPSAGVLTSWSHLAVTAPGQEMTLLAFRTVAPDTYRLVGKSARENIQSGELNTFATRVPVAAGDTLGLRVPGPSGCLAFSPDGHVIAGSPLHEPLVGDDNFLLAQPGQGARLNVRAQLEPDVDGDGFGDETQDTGPTIALTKVPKKKSRSAKAKIGFAADQQGVAFACTVDDKKAAPCSSPLKLKRLELGRHSVTIQGTDGAGFTGPPAKARWKVLPK